MHTAILYIQVPSIRIRFCLKIFFHLVKTVTWMHLFKKRNPQWRFFKTLASRLRIWDERERRSLNTMMSYIIYTTSIRFVCERCCRISIVLAFAWGPAKTIGIRYVRTRILKTYPDTCGRTGPKYLLTSNKLFPSVFNCWVHGCSRSWSFKRERSDLGQLTWQRSIKKDSSMDKLHTRDERAGSK